MKRKVDSQGRLQTADRDNKRQRLSTCDQLSDLSDEILIRILSHVSVQDLTTCQRLSHRLSRIAGDSQLWRAAYYRRFIWPRSRWLPRVKMQAHSIRFNNWLDERTLLDKVPQTDWKSQYKLRHNWWRGSCGISETPYSSQTPAPPILTQLHEGILYTVDASAGLRSWSYRRGQRLLASETLGVDQAGRELIPTALAVDSRGQEAQLRRLVVGFQDGTFRGFLHHKQAPRFELLHASTLTSYGSIVSLSYAAPYLLAMSESHLLLFSWTANPKPGTVPLEITSGSEPRLLTCLKTHTITAPCALSLRMSGDGIIAAAAYVTPTLSSGWAASVQELRISLNGTIMRSRVEYSLGVKAAATRKSESFAIITSRPKSISYSHPYLLVSYADNTLMLHLVASTEERLEIGSGRRLWGHTSGIFDAHVSRRGKAVSVSVRGDEVRVWELEESAASKSKKDRESPASIAVRPEWIHDDVSDLQTPLQRSSRLTSDLQVMRTGLDDITRAYAGFDDEHVVVFREHEHGRQALAVYDFS